MDMGTAFGSIYIRVLEYLAYVNFIRDSPRKTPMDESWNGGDSESDGCWDKCLTFGSLANELTTTMRHKINLQFNIIKHVHNLRQS